MPHAQPGDDTDLRRNGDPGAEGALPTTWRVLLPALPAAEPFMRGRVRRWLRALRWPASQLGDLLLATSEAISNSIEHAYRPPVPGPWSRVPGLVEIEGRLRVEPDGYRQVEVTVRDYGRWRPVLVQDEHGTRGIPLMRGCMDEVSIKGTDHGTEIKLRSRLVPPAVADR